MTIFRRKPQTAELQEKFLEVALSHVGYRARPGGISDFGKRVGYAGSDIPWAGAFIDCVALDAGLVIPSCVYTASGLAEFVHDGRARFEPQPGDIVFYNFPTGPAWGALHVGIVTGIENWNTDARFTAVEAQTDSGLPRGLKDRDGVYLRTRWKYDAILFARPDFERRPGRDAKMQTGIKKVKLRNVRPGRRNAEVQTVQDALTQAVDLRVTTPGAFDATTQEAYARWQRRLGFVGPDASGEPDPRSLAQLGLMSGIFEVAPDEN